VQLTTRRSLSLPLVRSKSQANVLDTPDTILRGVGIASALIGIVVIWLVRG
jgi:uncharacterized protein YjeT (DUF2065 family)